MNNKISNRNRLISIVTPLFNEENNVEILYNRISKVMKNFSYNYEHICIDNASTDNTVKLLKNLAKKDKRLKIIVNSRNFGYIRSSYHALHQAGGDGVILLSSDLQDPPEIIGDFIKKWESGFKIVLSVKIESEENALMFWFRSLYYKFMTNISEVPLIKNATGAGLFDRKILNILDDIKDPYPYFRGLLCEIGFPIATVPFKQPKRKRGVSKYNFYSLYDYAMLGMTKHSKIPLRIISMIGFVISFFSILLSILFLFAKLFFWNSFEFGLAPILIGIFFFGGLQCLFIGILGEYVISIQTHVRNMPHVIEYERVNF